MTLENLKYFDRLFKILRSHQIYPLETEQTRITRAFYVKAFIFYFCVSFPQLGFFFHLSMVVKASSTVLIEDVTLLVIFLSIVVIIVVYCYNLQEIIYSLNRMHLMYNSEKQMSKISNFFEMSIRFIHSGIGFVLVALGIFKLLDEDGCKDRNLKNESSETCFFMIPIWYPFSFDTGLMKYFFLGCQVVLTHFYISTLAVLAFLLVITFIHLQNGIKELKRKIKVVEFTGQTTKIKRELLKIIKYHCVVYRAIDECNTQTQYINLVCFICTGLIFALLTFHFLLTYWLGSFVLLAVWILFYSSLVVVSQLVIDEWVEVSFQIYDKNWYEMDVRLRYYILIILQRTQKVAYIKAGPISVLSMPLLLSVYKTAYSYITILLNTKFNK